MRIEYRHFQPVSVLYARSMGPYASSSRDAWRLVDEWLDQHRARKRVRQGLGVFRDDPRTTAPELLRYDACVPIIYCAELEIGPAIDRQIIQGGAFAVHTHVGRYDEAGEMFSHLHGKVVPERGLSVDYDRPFVAIYLNDPHVTREVHRRTELCVPVFALPVPANSNEGNTEADAVVVARAFPSA
jgi:DNA gyrase inhibitor GyrI